MTNAPLASAVRSTLDALESQSIYVIREAFAHFDRPAMLWSIGKDSTVLLWLARKAFFGHVPFPLVHIDTSFEIPEVIQYRDDLARQWNLRLIVGMNHAELNNRNTFPAGCQTRVGCCTLLKKDALKNLLDEHKFNGVIVGVRRDEEPTRAKERYFSPRNQSMEWHVEDQPPEFWGQFVSECDPGSHVRIHPLLHWTEINIWEYIEREKIPVVPQYFATNGIRHRSLGCVPCTFPIESTATTVREIIDELNATKVPERSGRAQDHESEDAFERLRRDGYM